MKFKTRKNKLNRFLGPVVKDITTDKDQETYKEIMEYCKHISLCPNCHKKYDIVDADRQNLKLTVTCERCWCSETFETPEVKEKLKWMNTFLSKKFGEMDDGEVLHGLILTDETKEQTFKDMK